MESCSFGEDQRSSTAPSKMTELLRKKLAAYIPKPPKEATYDLQEDQFCSGLVTHITQTYRRMYWIPFYVCIVSHTGIVCETTRGFAYYVEFVENNPVMMHDVTDQWRKRGKNDWRYGGYHWFFNVRYQLTVRSFNVQYVAKCYESLAAFRGDYVMSGNNCHVVAEELIRLLGLRQCGVNMHYGSYLGVGEPFFDAQQTLMPVFPL